MSTCSNVVIEMFVIFLFFLFWFWLALYLLLPHRTSASQEVFVWLFNSSLWMFVLFIFVPAFFGCLFVWRSISLSLYLPSDNVILHVLYTHMAVFVFVFLSNDACLFVFCWPIWSTILLKLGYQLSILQLVQSKCSANFLYFKILFTKDTIHHIHV